jgi:hypothetical protein
MYSDGTTAEVTVAVLCFALDCRAVYSNAAATESLLLFYEYV